MSSEFGIIVPQTAVDQNRNLIGAGNIQQPGMLDLAHAEDIISPEVRGRNDVLIIAHAAGNPDVGAKRAEDALKRFGTLSVNYLHNFSQQDVLKAIADAQAVYYAGGNTGVGAVNDRVLQHADGRYMDERSTANRVPIVNALRQKAADGVAIIGVSAGLMVMSDNIGTHTDPIEPSLQVTRTGDKIQVISGLGLVQGINFHPHWKEEENTQLEQFLRKNPGRTIFGLQDGAWITIKGKYMQYGGIASGAILRINSESQQLEIQTVRVGDNISQLLQETSAK